MLKKILLFLFLVLLGLAIYTIYVEKIFEKPLSPFDSVESSINDLKLKVTYNRPSKRGREIYGGLVPYNKVWRTGANEPTTFSTNRNIKINNQFLPKGKYTLWTKPGAENWMVYFNLKEYPWGVNEKMEAMRNPEFDQIKLKVPVEIISKSVEQFTIGFDNTTGEIVMSLVWDHVKISFPISESGQKINSL